MAGNAVGTSDNCSKAFEGRREEGEAMVNVDCFDLLSWGCHPS